MQIASERNDLDTARRAAESLRGVAVRFPSRWLSACASLAEARVALLGGDTARAIDGATQAVMAWVDIGAPYEAACSRLVLAAADALAGNVDGARMERQAAFEAFEGYGAALWARRVAVMIDGGTLVAVTQSTASVGEFRPIGGLRVVTFAGPTVSVRDLIGFRYLARLLGGPNREFHVLDLVSVERGTLPTAGVVDGGVDDSSIARGDGALPILDEQARAAYRARLAEVEDDIDDAERLNDLGRIEKAQHDRDYLITELAHAIGLGGRLRSSGGTTERARTSVTRSIRYALRQLARHHPMAAAHFERSVRTGIYCSYESDPMTPITWEI